MYLITFKYIMVFKCYMLQLRYKLLKISLCLNIIHIKILSLLRKSKNVPKNKHLYKNTRKNISLIIPSDKIKKGEHCPNKDVNTVIPNIYVIHVWTAQNK